MGRGLLVFKGDDPKKKKRKGKHKKKSTDDEEAVSSREVAGAVDARHDDKPAAAASSRAATSSTQASSPASVPSVTPCSGRITTSQQVVTGILTKFEREIYPGDALIVVLEDGRQEMRVVTMRLSNVSLNLSSAFSQNIKNPTKFSVIHKPRDQAKEKRLASQKEEQTKKFEEEKASGTFGSTDAVVYRERTEHGNYRIKRAGVKGAGVTRSAMLEMRSKKTSDKYC